MPINNPADGVVDTGPTISVEFIGQVTRDMVIGDAMWRHGTKIVNSHVKVWPQPVWMMKPPLPLDVSIEPDPMVAGGWVTVTGRVVAQGEDYKGRLRRLNAGDVVIDLSNISGLDAASARNHQSTCSTAPTTGTVFRIGTVERAQTCEVSMQVRINADAAAQPDLPRVDGKVTWASIPDPGVNNNNEFQRYSGAASAEVGVATTDLLVDFTAADDTIARGAETTLTLSVTSDTASNVTVRDIPAATTLPAGVTLLSVTGTGCTVSGTEPNATVLIDQIAAGEAAQCALRVKADKDTPSDTSVLSFTAEVTAPDGVVEPADAAVNLAVLDVPVEPEPVAPKVDLYATFAGVPAVVGVGDSASIRVVLGNNGQLAARDMAATIVLPAGYTANSCTTGAGECVVDGAVLMVTGVALTAGDVAQVTVELQAPLRFDADGAQMIARVENVGGGEDAVTLEDNRAMAQWAHRPDRDESITLSSEPTATGARGRVVLSAAVSDVGTYPAGPVRVIIPPSPDSEPVSCEPACRITVDGVVFDDVDLVDGVARVQVTFVTLSDRESYTLSGQVDVLDGPDSDDSDNTAALVIDPASTPAVDPAVTTTTATQTTRGGQSIEYVFTVTSEGFATLDELVLLATLDSALSDVVYVPSAGTFDPATGTWTGVSLQPGESLTLTVRARVSEDASVSVGAQVAVGLAASDERGAEFGTRSGTASTEVVSDDQPSTPQPTNDPDRAPTGVPEPTSPAPKGQGLATTGAGLVALTGAGTCCLLIAALMFGARRRVNLPSP